MKLLSDASEYALRAVVWLAQRPRETFKLREIADGTRAAPGYLIKALQSLTRAGVLSAQRGSNGGFMLIRDPKGISVLEVVNAVDPLQRIHTCPLGLASHGTCLCPMHKRIDDAVATIEASFGASTINDLLEEKSPSRPLCDALTHQE
ncbi:Rrf2 family transcriptional regulator [Ruficoccus amylovorans]|uniref:Rrf2 family transcriptional regulator n=1 Tax=Ruficoccus amylovorans TaxID=1804625 RepID=A0A842H8P7_9BACT|nr:Rrf2 family transcriptional regulator [Ruficoccus amylovorans]MBC2592903.1 Rrf2 family transcriptional regulator [Ruficoccus amylovorans]